MRQVIDAHVHVWNRSEEPQEWIDPETMPEIDRDFTLDDLETTLQAEQVGTAVVVQSVNSSKETESLLTATLGPAVAGVVGWCDLTAPDVRDTLDRLTSMTNGARLVGIRHLAHLEPDERWLRRADVRRGLNAVADAGLVFDLVVNPQQLRTCAEVVDEHPGLEFVLDHLGKPPLRSGAIGEWADDLVGLAARENVSAKVSGLTMEADWKRWTPEDLASALEIAFASFGPDRLMFGSDWPLVRTSGGYASWLDAARVLTEHLSAGEHDAVFFETAARVYGVGGAVDA